MIRPGKSALRMREIDWFEWSTEGLLMSVVGIVGLIGNLTSVIVYKRQRVQRTFHRLLLTLAAFDTVSQNILPFNPTAFVLVIEL